MYKQLLVFTFTIAYFFIPLPAQTLVELFAGQPVNTELGNLSYGSQGACFPDFDFAWWIDSTFIPFVDGVEVVVVVNSINAPMNSVEVSSNPVAVGDTIRFDTANYIPVYMAAGGTIDFSYRAVGTPTTVGQYHPCEMITTATLGFCANTVSLQGVSSPSDSCEVEVANSIAPPLSPEWQVGPIPSSGELRVRHRSRQIPWESLQLVNAQGQPARHWTAGSLPDLTGLPVGMYFLRINSPEGQELRRILVE